VTPYLIIAAVDVFERSPSAARCALWLAEAAGASLALVYVLDPGGFPALQDVEPVLRRELYERQEERARAHALEQLEALASELTGASTEITVLEGQPVPTLERLAAERDAALLVTGTVASEGLDYLLHGSVPARLAARVSCPVVVAPPDAEVAGIGPVLVGDDGSDESRLAMLHAGAIATRLTRDVVRLRVDEGDPVIGIRDAAHRQQACLVVSGHRGRGPLRTALFGSVTAGLVQKAGRPVMVVPPSAGHPAS
jgi:nucleotide-binding universal stress UspA family protein